MNRGVLLASICVAALSIALAGGKFLTHVSAEDQALSGYSAETSRNERQWEEKFRELPSPDNLRSAMQHLSARPHHVGSPYDKENAEWLAAKFKDFGFDTHIEQFDVLFPRQSSVQWNWSMAAPNFPPSCRSRRCRRIPPRISSPSSFPPITPTRKTETSPRRWCT